MLKIFTLLAALLTAGTVSAADAHSKRIYEMRTYTTHEGKLEDLHKRFRDHTLRLFVKHGITSVGYWVPVNNTENKLIFVLSYANREARETAWKAFASDPDWQAAAKASEANGKILSKAPEVVFLEPTDYSPMPKIEKASGDRVYELRTYTSAPGKLDGLNARFRNHTVKLFEKHGIKNVIYWTPMKDQKGAEDTLVYFLSHKSEDEAKKSYAAFGKDTDWQTARTESEKAGPLTAPNGIKSLFLKATDYSPMQ